MTGQTEIVHVTRIGTLNGDVFGHTTAHCDPSGCAGDEQYFGNYDNVEADRTYELDLDNHTVVAEVDE